MSDLQTCSEISGEFIVIHHLLMLLLKKRKKRKKEKKKRRRNLKKKFHMEYTIMLGKMERVCIPKY